MSSFFSRLSYSFGNEDWDTEQQALKIKPGDRVLSITASGDRSLHPFLEADCEVVSIDANPIQNFLLDLKKAAMQQLDYNQYISFLGAFPNRFRAAQLTKLTDSMKPEAAKYWLKELPSIESGILYQGALEQMTKKTSKFINLFKGSKIKKLFSFTDVEDQRAYVKKEWNSYVIRKLFDVGLHPLVTRWMLNDPGLYVPSSLSLGAYFHQRINNCLERYPAKSCALLSLILTGNIHKDSFPPYLTREGYHKIRPRLHKLSYQTNDIVSYLESALPNSFDTFSLSDVASYLSKDDFHRLLKGIYRTARPGARFSIRQVLSDHHIPEFLDKSFHRDIPLERRLEEEDRCFVYRYFTGHVVK